MNVDYIRNLNKNYIKIESQDDFFEYQVQMITRNSIEGLLKCTDERIDNKIYFLYEINSKQPFIQVFERQKMNFQAFMGLIECLRNVVDNVSEFLLDVNSIIILPEYIYMNPETKDIQLLYLPGSWQDIKDDFHELSRKILDWIDYKDEKAVTAAYDLFKQTSEENYSLEEILESMTDEDINQNEIIQTIEDNTNSDYSCEDEVIFSIEKNTQEVFVDDEKSAHIEDKREKSSKSSIMKKFTDSLLVAEKWIKRLSFADRHDEEEEEYEDIIDNVINYSDYAEKNISNIGLAEENAGYGNTVFFSAAVAKNKQLCSIDNSKYDNFKINIYPFIIGKLQEAVDGVIEDDSVSRIHAKIEKADNQYYLVDLNSTNGTFLNGQIVSPNEKTKLKVGDRIQFGFVEYRFEND